MNFYKYSLKIKFNKRYFKIFLYHKYESYKALTVVVLASELSKA